MLRLLDFGVILSMISVAGYLFLALRIRHLGLTPYYAHFSRYLVAEAFGVSTLVFLMLIRRPRWAAVAYMMLQPMLWIFYFLVTLELYRGVLSRFRGISRVVQRVLVAGLLLSVLASFSGIFADLQLDRHASAAYILFVTAGHRSVVGSLTLFLLILTAFLAWFPIPISRNAILHTTLFFNYFLFLTVGHLYRNLTGTAVTPAVNLSLALLTNICLGLWIWRLRPEGEQPPKPPGKNLPASGWLVEQMEALNRVLLRTPR